MKRTVNLKRGPIPFRFKTQSPNSTIPSKNSSGKINFSKNLKKMNAFQLLKKSSENSEPSRKAILYHFSPRTILSIKIKIGTHESSLFFLK